MAADAPAAVAAEKSQEVGGQAEVILTDEQSMRLERSSALLDVFNRSIEELSKLGAVTAAGAVHNEIRKEERRRKKEALQGK